MSRHIAASLAAALGAGLTTSCLFAAFEEALGELFRTLSSWQLADPPALVAVRRSDPLHPRRERRRACASHRRPRSHPSRWER
jgi:hypothetical protein